MKTLAAASLVAITMAGCASSDPHQRRADQVRERQERRVEQAVSRSPRWMSELPRSDIATYANGTAVSPDLEMSVAKAKVMAYGKICMAAGGRVDQRTKVYRMDNEDTGAEFSELAVRSMCPGVDITGVEVNEIKTVAEGDRFRTYVLVVLPRGAANPLVQERDARRLRNTAEQRSQEAFREMDRR